MARFSEAEVIEVWDRWQEGDAYRLIGRDLGRSAGSIRAFVESWGGVRPRVRRRAERHLSLTEREEISRGVAAGESLRMVAARLRCLVSESRFCPIGPDTWLIACSRRMFRV